MLHSSVRPAELPGLLADLPPEVRYLSLDCFDTLLWRNVHKPTDIFAELPLPGGSELRQRAEAAARADVFQLRSQRDVSLDEIHERLLPASRAAERQVLIEAELEAEARHCYIFAPILDLISEARRRGLSVIIVSDTYLNEKRLRTLIERAGGGEALSMIDRIFCSCEYGVAKPSGLFEAVLTTLHAAPEEILHLGDNPVSDQQAPARIGIHTAHLVQFDNRAEQRLRHEAAVAAVMEAEASVSPMPIQAHRPQIARRASDDALFALGHDVLGPILHGFAVWLRAEAEALEKQTGKRAKLLFLMRDGHMPARAFATLYPEWQDRVLTAEISRFTSRAASFTDPLVIQRYLMDVVPTRATPAFIAQQLLFDKEEQHRFTATRGRGDLVKKLVLPFNVEKITTRSNRMAERLCAHLRANGVEDGDTVLMVDLGYNGTVQNAAEPMLRQKMQLDIHGRYLLLCEDHLSGLDKKGLFDLRHYSMEVLRSLFQDISILEMMCTVAQGSVLDYDRDGTPIRGEADLHEQQGEYRDAAQAAALAYLAHVREAVVAPPASADVEGWRRTALSVLGRLIFLPSAEETGIFSCFQLDVNMGTKMKVGMIDTAAAEDGMRRRGLTYVKNGERIYQAAELRGLGLPLNLSMLTISRFALQLRAADFDVGGPRLPIVLLDGGEPIVTTVDAHPTSDGYYRALVPIGRRRYSVGLRLASLGHIIQIEEAAYLPVGDLTGRERLIPAQPILDGMEEMAAGLYRCDGAQSFMLLPPPAAEDLDESLSWVLSLVLRPIIKAGESQAAQKKAA
ncbi:FMN phosphatase YigB (HAD superfamily) [Sphingomonas endophytica]|uniref:FMN phosphatase YigB (HAD superfamily) n=1 Tax=Sphingomonas endophytica TaxID=869719 RepID=A0A7X0JEX4_9SPHN|nr:HAD family hydrolase [Sphingomonas endophytica]MBB6505392.1 FMN phosphatase YigB (HAD superfamily) [Sphingomonas endophytica]